MYSLGVTVKVPVLNSGASHRSTGRDNKPGCTEACTGGALNFKRAASNCTGLRVITVGVRTQRWDQPTCVPLGARTSIEELHTSVCAAMTRT